MSASVNLPLHHTVQKFSSGTGSPGWSQKKGRKTVVVCVVVLENAFSALTLFVGWPEKHAACNNMGVGGGGHWLVRMDWRPAGWSVCLPLLIFPCIKSRSSVLAPAHPGGHGKKGP